MSDLESPSLSVVVAIVSDTTKPRANVTDLIGCLESIAEQKDAPAMEIIVPYHPRVDGIDEVKRRFPDVRLVYVDDLPSLTGTAGSREHHDELRARGMRVARGELVGLLEDHARADPMWAARMAEMHREGYAGVGGAIENGLDRPLNWAVYFCDFGRYQNPMPAGDSELASDANVVYKRPFLESIRDVWENRFDEPSVNWALKQRGERLGMTPEAVVYQYRTGLGLSNALQERYIWGRSYAATRSRTAGPKRFVYAATAPLLPAVLLLRMSMLAVRKGRTVGAFLKALPLTALLVTSWSWGELLGYLTGRSD